MPRQNFLRPPGVTSETDLQARCTACGQCAEVCIFQCIRMMPDSLLGIDRPRIYAAKSPCFLCMKCSDTCPTNALRRVTPHKAGMGKAFLNTAKCLEYQQESSIMCWTCYEKCPLKGQAIVLKYGYISTITDECVGCGVCEYVCPVKAIQTKPAAYPEK